MCSISIHWFSFSALCFSAFITVEIAEWLAMNCTYPLRPMQYDTVPCLIFSCCFNVSYSRDTHSLPWSSVAKWHESYHLQAFLSDWNGSSDIWLVRKCRLFLGQDSGTSRLVLDRTDTKNLKTLHPDLAGEIRMQICKVQRGRAMRSRT